MVTGPTPGSGAVFSRLRSRAAPLGPWTDRSTAQQRFAISSRRNSTSSYAAPSCTATAPGGISSPGMAGPSTYASVASSQRGASVIRYSCQCPSGLTCSVGCTRKRSPKVVTYITDSTVTRLP